MDSHDTGSVLPLRAIVKKADPVDTASDLIFIESKRSAQLEQARHNLDPHAGAPNAEIPQRSAGSDRPRLHDADRGSVR